MFSYHSETVSVGVQAENRWHTLKLGKWIHSNWVNLIKILFTKEQVVEDDYNE